MDEGDFHREVTEATGYDMLLDDGNLYANACNAGRDPSELLSRYPLDRVAMLHVAGGATTGGFYFDTHAHALSDDVVELVARAVAATGDVPVVLERDASFPPFVETSRDLQRLSAIPCPPARSREVRAPVPVEGAPPGRMGASQRAMAILLTAAEAPDDASVVRARGFSGRSAPTKPSACSPRSPRAAKRPWRSRCGPSRARRDPPRGRPPRMRSGSRSMRRVRPVACEKPPMSIRSCCAPDSRRTVRSSGGARRLSSSARGAPTASPAGP